jgi:hypothetical protein
MRVHVGLLALLVCVCVARSAPQDITTLDGKVIKGEVVSISDTEITYTAGDKRVTRPIKEILRIDLRPVERPGAKTPHAQVELVDGSQFLCGKYAIKGRQIELSLLSGPTVTLPLTVVRSVLNNAQAEAYRKDLAARLAKRPGTDVLLLINAGRVDSLNCTLGAGSEDGASIEFSFDLDGEVVTRTRALKEIQGLIFKRTLDPKAPAVICKLLGTQGDVVMVSGVTLKGGALSVKTPAGAALTLKADAVGQLDYAKGRFEYLSEMEPSKVVTRSNVEEGDKAEQKHIYRDQSVRSDGRERKPLRLGGTSYAKGLALRPYTEMEFDLKGDFSGFSAVVGLDDNVPADGTVTLIVEGDGREMRRVTFTSSAKLRHLPVALNVKDVQKLRVIVKTDDWLDLGKHLNLADAKVSK